MERLRRVVKEEAEAELSNVRLGEVVLQLERLDEVVTAGLNERFADFEGGFRERTGKPVDQHDADIGQLLPELARQSQPGEPPAADRYVIFWNLLH